MKMSDGGVNTLLKPFEGCKLKAYRCPANILTIGYGHTSAAGMPTVIDGMTITQAQADNILRQDLAKYETAVAELVQVELSQNQFDVLVDFAYNAGPERFKNSTLLKRVNAKNFDAVPAELMKWTKGGGNVLPGLVRRRQAEVNWWNANHEQVPEPQEGRATPDAPPQRTMAGSKQGNAAALTAGLGSLGAAKEVVAQAQDAANTADQLVALLHNTNFLIMVAIIGAAAAIWYWRRQNMEKYGV